MSINADSKHTDLKGSKISRLFIKATLKQPARKLNDESWNLAPSNDVLPFYRQQGIKVSAVERYNRTVVDEFFRIAFREKYYPDIPSLQKDLDGWLKHYNYERPHQGYGHMGKRPFDTMGAFKKNNSTDHKED